MSSLIALAMVLLVVLAPLGALACPSGGGGGGGGGGNPPKRAF